jgi:hypothetical protein
MRSALEAPRLMIAEGRHSPDVIVDEMGSRERSLHQATDGKATAQAFLNERWNVVATMRRPQNDPFEGPAHINANAESIDLFITLTLRSRSRALRVSFVTTSAGRIPPAGAA